jgi:prolyl oligopeptidase PreP (S9A serine peptidase family)
MGYPSAPRNSATDHFISLKSGLVKIPNPYKWLEDATSPYKKIFISSQNSQFDAFIQDPDLDIPRQALEQALLQPHSLPSLAGILQFSGNYHYYRVAGQGAFFPVTYRVRKTVATTSQMGQVCLDLREVSQ